jgi:hypothetical protein
MGGLLFGRIPGPLGRSVGRGDLTRVHRARVRLLPQIVPQILGFYLWSLTNRSAALTRICWRQSTQRRHFEWLCFYNYILPSVDREHKRMLLCQQYVGGLGSFMQNPISKLFDKRWEVIDYNNFDGLGSGREEPATVESQHNEGRKHISSPSLRASWVAQGRFLPLRCLQTLRPPSPSRCLRREPVQKKRKESTMREG